MKYRAVLRTGYDGWGMSYYEFNADSDFHAFAKLLKNYTTYLDYEAIEEENITDFETLVNVYKQGEGDGGFDEILLLMKGKMTVFIDDNTQVILEGDE